MEREMTWMPVLSNFMPLISPSQNFARLLTKSEEDAEDIAQNIFLKLWTRPELWEGQETMTSYLYTVTRNEIFNLFKHQKVEQEYEDKV